MNSAEMDCCLVIEQLRQKVKYCYQYIDMTIDEGNIYITNNYLFSNLNEYVYTIELNRNGQCLEKKEPQTISCEPAKTVTIKNPFVVKSSTDQYDVIVRFASKEGHEVAYQQYVYEKKEVKEIFWMYCRI